MIQNLKKKKDFFQAVSVLLYGYSIWMLMKHMKKKLDVIYTRMLCAVLSKSWKQRPTKQQLYSHLPSISQTVQVKQIRHPEYCCRSKDQLISDIFLWTLTEVCQSWPTSKDLHTSALCQEWMQSRGPAWSDRW